jgi:hypothetical protein
MGLVSWSIPNASQMWRVVRKSCRIDVQIVCAHLKSSNSFPILESRHIVGVDGYVLVFSVYDRTSFQYAIQVYRSLKMETASTPVFLVGTRVEGDTINCTGVGGLPFGCRLERQVEEDEAKKVAQNWDCPFAETLLSDADMSCQILEMLISRVEISWSGAQTSQWLSPAFEAQLEGSVGVDDGNPTASPDEPEEEEPRNKGDPTFFNRPENSRVRTRERGACLLC